MAVEQALGALRSEVAAARGEVAELRGEVKVANTIASETNRRLFGNGQPGELAELRNDLDDNKKVNDLRHTDNTKRLDKIELDQRWVVRIAVGSIALIGFLTGSGRISLEKLLQHFGH